MIKLGLFLSKKAKTETAEDIYFLHFPDVENPCLIRSIRVLIRLICSEIERIRHGFKLLFLAILTIKMAYSAR
jgi:hypothetical protein